jgi:hypothetical protein
MNIKKLVSKAMKNSFKANPVKGYIYLKNIPVGSVFYTQNGMKGVLLECETNAVVIILDVKTKEKNKPYYLGKQIIGAETEVRIK